LSVARCQLPVDPSAVLAGGQLPAAVPTSMTASRNGSGFGNVLSAKMSRPAANREGPLTPARRASATTAETVSSQDRGAAKLGIEKRTGEDLAVAVTAVAVQVLPAQPFVPSMPEDPHPGNVSLGGVPDSNVAADLGGTPGLNAASPPPPISSVLASAMPAQEAITSPSPIGKQDASPAADQQNLTSGPVRDQSLSSAPPLVEAIALAKEQPTSRTATVETTTHEGVASQVASSGTVSPEATQRDPEHSSAPHATPESGRSADTSQGTSNPANAVVSAAPPQKLPTDAPLPAFDDAAGNRRSDSTDRKQSIGSKRTEPLTTSEQTGAQASQFVIDDSFQSKPVALTQPVHSMAIRDEQPNADTSSSVVLPVAARPAATSSAAGADRPQTVSDPAASSSAENTQTAPTVIQSAQVLERMGKSEIRLGLNSSNFGNIELHTSLNQDRVGATIATSHAELRTAMMAEMPTLEHAIAQHQMKLDSLQLDSRSSPPAGDRSASGGNQSGSRGGTPGAAISSEPSEDTAAQEVSLPQAGTALHSSALNVHA